MRKLAFLLALELLINAYAYNRKINTANLTKNMDQETVQELTEELAKHNIAIDEDGNVIINRKTEVAKEEIVTPTPEEVIQEEKPYEIQFGYIKSTSNLILDTGEVKEIEKYQRVLLLNENEDSYYVETYDQETGYISKDRVSIIPNTFVEVDISTQKLNFYIDGEIFLTSNVVTGKKSTPTHEGYFKINDKSRNVYLTGPTWKSFVKYWMPYDEGRGLHDANWREASEFNETTYVNNGSHGCVNLPVDVAPKVYENVEVGTKVLVHK